MGSREAIFSARVLDIWNNLDESKKPIKQKMDSKVILKTGCMNAENNYIIVVFA